MARPRGFKGKVIGQLAQKKAPNVFTPRPVANAESATGSTSGQAAQFSSTKTPATSGGHNPPAQAPSAPASAPSAPDPFSVSSYNPKAGQPDPRDATYFANLAKLEATAHESYSAGQLAQTQSDVNYQAELGTRAEQRRRSVRNLAESMLGRGLLRSGYHNRGQTEGTTDYLTALTGLQTSKSQEDAKRAAEMAAILSNLGIEEQGLYADAASRYTQTQADLAANAPASGPSNPGGSSPSGGNPAVYNNPAAYNRPKKKKR